MIHVAVIGETAASIAGEYGISEARLRFDNELPEGVEPVAGQALIVLIPEQVYTAVAGDTVATVAAQLGVSERRLLQNNPFLLTTELAPGLNIVVRYQGQQSAPAAIIGYAYPFIGLALLRETLLYINSLYIFSYGFTTDGELIAPDDDTLLSEARSFGVSSVLVLTPYTDADSFDSNLINSLVNDPQAQENLLNNLVEVMNQKGYSGVDMDFEYIDGRNRQAYSNFVARAAEVMHANGFTVAVALAPKTSADQRGLLYEGIDYRALGESADSVLLMTYEWGYTYGPPLAVAPLPNVQRVLQYALTEIPAGKILIGVPNYGYDWPLPYIQGTTRAETIGNTEAVSIARANGVPIEYSIQSQAPFFRYSLAGIDHVVWFEDVRSVEQKLNLITTYGIRGAGYWNLMRPFRQNWLLVGQTFAP